MQYLDSAIQGKFHTKKEDNKKKSEFDRFVKIFDLSDTFLIVTNQIEFIFEFVFLKSWQPGVPFLVQQMTYRIGHCLVRFLNIQCSLGFRRIQNNRRSFPTRFVRRYNFNTVVGDYINTMKTTSILIHIICLTA